MSSAIKDIISIIPDKAYASPLQKATIKEILEDWICGTVYEGKFAVVDNQDDNFTIKLNWTPDETFNAENNPTRRFLLHYYPNFRVFSDGDFSEFSDYDESDMSAGKWKLPSDWHMLIVKGAIAMLFPEERQDWEMQCEDRSRKKYTNADLKLKATLGLSRGRRGR